MGSRIMHAIIGHRIASSLQMENKRAFLLGNIAPDAVFSNGRKTASHFYIGEHDDFTKGIDYEGFLEKYPTESDNKYVLGYFTHLIADDLWLNGFYVPWLKNRMEANADLHMLYHQDFKVLNGKLLEHYKLSKELYTMLQILPDIIDLEEVKGADVERFIPYLLEDMDYKQEILDTELTVFTLQQIIGYIETAVHKGIYHLTRIIE